MLCSRELGKITNGDSAHVAAVSALGCGESSSGGSRSALASSFILLFGYADGGMVSLADHAVCKFQSPFSRQSSFPVLCPTVLLKLQSAGPIPNAHGQASGKVFPRTCRRFCRPCWCARSRPSVRDAESSCDRPTLAKISWFCSSGVAPFRSGQSYGMVVNVQQPFD